MTLLAILLPLAQAHDVRVDVLDVGQGDSILVRFTAAGESKAVLIDAGPPSADVAGQLVRAGVDHLDLVVSTHPHADHIGGTRAVLEAFPPRVYLDGGTRYTTQTWRDLSTTVEERKAAGMRVVHPGTSFRQARFATDVTLTLLSPLPGDRFVGAESDENARSIVLRLDHGEDCFLFMGDAELVTERVLLERGVAPCGVLKVGHHGSDGATSAAFLAAVRPKLGLVSVGGDNNYGHPGTATLGRLAQAGVTVARTDVDGPITVWSSGHGVTVGSATPPAAPSPGVPAPPVPYGPYPTGRTW